MENLKAVNEESYRKEDLYSICNSIIFKNEVKHEIEIPTMIIVIHSDKIFSICDEVFDAGRPIP